MSSLAQSGLDDAVARHRGARRRAPHLHRRPKRAEREEGKAASYTRGITVADRDLLFSAAAARRRRAHTLCAALGRKDIIGDTGRRPRAPICRRRRRTASTSSSSKLARGRLFTDGGEPRAITRCASSAHKTAKAAVGRRRASATRMHARPACAAASSGSRATLEFCGMDFGFDWLDCVVVPLETRRRHRSQGASRRAACMLKTDDESNNDIVKRIANALLERAPPRRRRLPDLRLRARDGQVHQASSASCGSSSGSSPASRCSSVASAS